MGGKNDENQTVRLNTESTHRPFATYDAAIKGLQTLDGKTAIKLKGSRLGKIY